MIEILLGAGLAVCVILALLGLFFFIDGMQALLRQRRERRRG